MYHSSSLHVAYILSVFLLKCHFGTVVLEIINIAIMLWQLVPTHTLDTNGFVFIAFGYLYI